MKTELKIKIKSLAAEARIIRSEEKKWPGQSYVRSSLHGHRTGIVRNEARHSQLAYGFLRGRPYVAMEQKAKTEPNWDRVENIAVRFRDSHGGQTPQNVKQRFAEWKPAA